MNELEQYKERLRIALSAARICIFEVDILRQQYTFFENAETIFGVSGDDILKDVQPYSVLEPEMCIRDRPTLTNFATLVEATAFLIALENIISLPNARNPCLFFISTKSPFL